MNYLIKFDLRQRVTYGFKVKVVSIGWNDVRSNGMKILAVL